MLDQANEHPGKSGSTQYVQWIIAVIVALGFGPALMLYSYLGRYIRPVQDDFCTIADIQEFGILGTVSHEYQTWSARSSYIFTLAVFQSLGRTFMSVLPTLLIVGLIVSIALMLLSLQRFVFASRSFVGALTLAAVITYTLFTIHRGGGQIIWWDSGSVIYITPIIFQMLFFAILFRKIDRHPTPPVWFVLFCGIASFLLSGYSEGQSLLHICILGSMLGLAVIFGVKRLFPYLPALAVSIIGSFAFLAISYFSPGHSYRSTTSAPREETFDVLILNTLTFTNTHLRNSYWHSNKRQVLALLVISVVCAIVFIRRSESARNWPTMPFTFISLVLVYLFTYGFYVLNAFTTFFSTGGQPTQRVMTSSYWLMILAVTFTGLLIGLWISRMLQHVPSAVTPPVYLIGIAMMVAVVWLGPVGRASELRALEPEMAEYAQMYDDRHANALETIAKGENDLVLPILPGRFGEADIVDRDRFWVNQCMARYYKVDTVIGEEPAP